MLPCQLTVNPTGRSVTVGRVGRVEATALDNASSRHAQVEKPAEASWHCGNW